MLSKREKDILKQFVNSNDFLSSKQIADHFDKSVRTIQMDIKNLDVILNNQGARLIHHQRKGYKIEVYNQTKFYSFYQQELLDEEFCGSRLERTIYILNYLLEFDDYVKIDDLADQLFVSKSSLNQNIKEVKNILDKYQITLEHKPYYGIHIVASEEQKRNCIMNELMAINHIFDEDDHRMFDCISDICSSCFVKSQYKIDDVAIMNLLIHVYVNVKRMMKHQHIQFEPDEAFMSLFSHEIVLAREIYDLISKELNIQVNDDEINYLALCIKAKRNYDKQDVITEEMNRLISEMFEYIREKTSMDLSYDIELQVALALHFIPLKIRVEHHMQLKNPMVYDIKQKFTFAYELAILSNMFLNEKYGWLLNENELGYLAVHYNLSLEKQTYYVKAKRVLVVSSSRTSDSLLLKYTLKNWFKDMILEIDVLNLFQLDQQKLQRYDVIFTTIKDQSKLSFPAIQINYFLNEDDYIKIRRALYSNREKNVLLNYFEKRLFIPKLDAKNKEEVIRELTSLIKQYKQIDSDLYESVMVRESYGFTSFGNYVALPHPNDLIVNETFVASAILNEPIQWGSQKVQLVFLICIEKDNQYDLKNLFGMLSRLLSDANMIHDIIEHKNFEYLIHCLSQKI